MEICENETYLHTTACACKGVRTCLICENKPGPNISDRSVQVPRDFMYDEITSEAVLYSPTQCTESSLRFKFPGVIIIKDLISPEEETELINAIDSRQWKPSQSGRYKQDFGPKVNFKKQKIKLSTYNGMPQYSRFIIERLQDVTSLGDFKTVELCNLEYLPERGSSIDQHFDDTWLWGERLVTLNLLSDTYLTMSWGSDSNGGFPNLSKTGINPNELRVKIPLLQRSLVVLASDARNKWKHGILREDINGRRVCCTFRELSEEFLSGSRKCEGDAIRHIANQYSGDVVW